MKDKSNCSDPAGRGWKGVGKISGIQSPMRFSRKRQNNETDMTSMVDVTFLLLIFFMVTASFSVQKAMAITPHNDLLSIHTDPFEDPDRFVTIEIDHFNTFAVSHGNSHPVEAASDSELRSRLRDLKASTGVDHVVILADDEAWHEKMITAMDAAMMANFAEVRVGSL